MYNLLLRNNMQIAIYCVALLPTFASFKWLRLVLS